MSDRAWAWYWIAAAVVATIGEALVYALWREWFGLVRGGHWGALVMAAFYFGRHRGRIRRVGSDA